jgi:Cd2+/Zn2+-exporting ATPase
MKDHTITDHAGIIAVEPLEGEKVEIVFDPGQLSEQELRRIALEHLRPAVAPMPGGLTRCVMRLDGKACEAAAAKLERRIETVPGVRRATATYIGRVLCLTFDRSTHDEAQVLAGVRSLGAKIQPLEHRPAARPSIRQRLRAGDLNEEVSCGLGLLCLVAAAVIEHVSGRGGLSLSLYAGAYLFGGQYGVRSAMASLRERTLDVDLLMVLAALGAAAVGAPFEGALLLFLFSFSNVLQRHALERTQRAIESLLTLRPDTALRKAASGPELVPIDSLEVGDVVIVRPGELLPADGRVIEGRGTIDESSLTGESMPVAKEKGAEVFAGTLNQSGGLEVVVARKSEDSTLAKMVKLVAEAQAEKSNTQRFLEKAEQTYAAGVIAFTAVVFLVPWFFLGEPFSTAFYRAMTLMVVASPCALIISTPATVLSAIGGAARRGILIKGGLHLETAARVGIVCFDKTGTLTAGKPRVTCIMTARGTESPWQGELSAEASGFLAACAALEAKSEHPLAAAITAAAGRLRLGLRSAAGFQSITGKGAEARIDGTGYVVGSEGFLRELGAEGMEVFRERAQAQQERGSTCIWLGRRATADRVEAVAVFALADTIRPEARQISARLREMGVKKVVMLTGDQRPVAAAIAAEAGIDEFYAQLLPADKVQVIRRLKTEGTVMMVGDGVNDAPALAAANLGVAMGAAGSDIAMETADVVLMGDKLENIAALVGMSRHAKRVLQQNLTFASAVIVLLVAAALGFDLPLPVGVIGHEGSTVLVCLNGLRLLVYRPPAS